MPYPGTLSTSALVAAIAAIATPCAAQTRLTSLEELQRELVLGDTIIVVFVGGDPVEGRLMRLDNADLRVRILRPDSARNRGPTDLTIPLNGIQSLERRRDSTRNGIVKGASVGAGIAGGMFLTALAIDRNEIDEWAPFYAGAGAAVTGIGALVGWLIDRAISKPHIRFEISPGSLASVGYSRGPRIRLAISLGR